MKTDLVSRPHPQSKAIEQRHADVMRRWERLRKDSEAHKARLQRALEQCHKVQTTPLSRDCHMQTQKLTLSYEKRQREMERK